MIMAPYMYHAHPFGGAILIIGVWVVQLLIAVVIWRDAREQKMLAPVWVILAILPMFGFITDVLYLILRELRTPRTTEKLASL